MTPETEIQTAVRLFTLAVDRVVAAADGAPSGAGPAEIARCTASTSSVTPSVASAARRLSTRTLWESETTKPVRRRRRSW